MKKIILTTVFLFGAMIAFSNVINNETNKKVNSKNETIKTIIDYETSYSIVDYKLTEKTNNLFCQYTMTSSYMGGPSFTATIYCNEGDNQKEQQEFVRSVARAYYFLFQF